MTAAAPAIPNELRDQLADGGRLVIPVGPRDHQVLTLVVRHGDDWHETTARRRRLRAAHRRGRVPGRAARDATTAGAAGSESRAGAARYTRPAMTHVFVAPHPDDVALSCGGLIASLRELGQNVTIITVFSGEDVDGDDGLTPVPARGAGLRLEDDVAVDRGVQPRARILPDYPLGPAWAAERRPARGHPGRRRRRRQAVLAALVVVSPGEHPQRVARRPAGHRRPADPGRGPDRRARRCRRGRRPDGPAAASRTSGTPTSPRRRSSSSTCPTPSSAATRATSSCSGRRATTTRARSTSSAGRSTGSSRSRSTCRSASVATSTTSSAARSASTCWPRAGAGSCPGRSTRASVVVLRGLPVRAVERLPRRSTSSDRTPFADLPADVSLFPAYADISDQIEKKITGISIYESQIERLFDGTAPDGRRRPVVRRGAGRARRCRRARPSATGGRAASDATVGRAGAVPTDADPSSSRSSLPGSRSGLWLLPTDGLLERPRPVRRLGPSHRDEWPRRRSTSGPMPVRSRFGPVMALHLGAAGRHPAGLRHGHRRVRPGDPGR